MQTISDRGGSRRESTPLVLIHAQALAEGYDRAAFWQARVRQARDADRLGRTPDHWRRVAEVLRGSDVVDPDHAGDRP